MVLNPLSTHLGGIVVPNNARYNDLSNRDDFTRSNTIEELFGTLREDNTHGHKPGDVMLYFVRIIRATTMIL